MADREAFMTHRMSRLMKVLLGVMVATGAWGAESIQAPAQADPAQATRPVYSMSPIGWVRKAEGRTWIEIDKGYQPALLGVEDLQSIWVFYWFDRNDTPERRSILRVHPRRNPENPLRGVFATRAPVRPNLIALSRVRVLSVRENVIEIDGIDAFPDTPVLDLKP